MNIKGNFISGVLSVASGTGAFTMTSPDSGGPGDDGLPVLPAVVVTDDFCYLVLDPTREHGNPEIIRVNTHTLSATTADVQAGGRAAFSTTARNHPIGTRWALAHLHQEFDFPVYEAVPAAQVSAISSSDTEVTQLVIPAQLFSYQLRITPALTFQATAIGANATWTGRLKIDTVDKGRGNVSVQSGDALNYRSIAMPAILFDVETGASVTLSLTLVRSSGGSGTANVDVNTATTGTGRTSIVAEVLPWPSTS